jgi:hypothetical protein
VLLVSGHLSVTATAAMADVHFEDGITLKRSLSPCLCESAYVGYQAETSVNARTAMGRNPSVEERQFITPQRFLA